MLIRDILDIKNREGGGDVIHAASPASPIKAAIHTMASHAVGSVVVIEDGRLQGLVTLREILTALDTRGCTVLELTAGDVMNPEPITGRPDDSIDYVRQVMTENHVSHLPVMDGDRLLGIISLQDVAKAAYSECSFENRLLKRYIRHWPNPGEGACHSPAPGV